MQHSLRLYQYRHSIQILQTPRNKTIRPTPYRQGKINNKMPISKDLLVHTVASIRRVSSPCHQPFDRHPTVKGKISRSFSFFFTLFLKSCTSKCNAWIKKPEQLHKTQCFIVGDPKKTLDNLTHKCWLILPRDNGDKNNMLFSKPRRGNQDTDPLYITQ